MFSSIPHVKEILGLIVALVLFWIFLKVGAFVIKIVIGLLVVALAVYVVVSFFR